MISSGLWWYIDRAHGLSIDQTWPLCCHHYWRPFTSTPPNSLHGDLWALHVLPAAVQFFAHWPSPVSSWRLSRFRHKSPSWHLATQFGLDLWHSHQIALIGAAIYYCIMATDWRFGSIRMPIGTRRMAANLTMYSKALPYICLPIPFRCLWLGWRLKETRKFIKCSNVKNLKLFSEIALIIWKTCKRGTDVKMG